MEILISERFLPLEFLGEAEKVNRHVGHLASRC